MAKRKHPRPVCTPEERQALYDLQGGVCAICMADNQELHTDHSYRTGRTRGLLCRQCNCGLGMLGDSPKLLRAALQYFANPQPSN
jgi:hypothetical protein